jgi:hypothetical protein
MEIAEPARTPPTMVTMTSAEAALVPEKLRYDTPLGDFIMLASRVSCKVLEKIHGGGIDLQHRHGYFVIKITEQDT